MWLIVTNIYFACFWVSGSARVWLLLDRLGWAWLQLVFHGRSSSLGYTLFMEIRGAQEARPNHAKTSLFLNLFWLNWKVLLIYHHPKQVTRPSQEPVGWGVHAPPLLAGTSGCHGQKKGWGLVFAGHKHPLSVRGWRSPGEPFGRLPTAHFPDVGRPLALSYLFL